MAEKKYLGISMLDGGENIQFEVEGNLVEISYMACEIVNQLKKSMLESGVTEPVAKVLLLDAMNKAWDDFK